MTGEGAGRVRGIVSLVRSWGEEARRKEGQGGLCRDADEMMRKSRLGVGKGLVSVER